MTKPLMIDLCCGLGGWAEGGLAEGYEPIGFDIERHIYDTHAYPAQLVIQDVLTLHGSQIKEAALIVASPPCQEYSYMAMPWTRAKEKAKAIRADESGKMLADLTALFNTCFRIQREASEAAGHHIPMVVENVRGAIPWVGRSRWNFGSYHLWGDVPALMPFRRKTEFNKMPPEVNDGIRNGQSPPRWTNRAEDGYKVPGMTFSGNGTLGYKSQGFNVIAAQRYRAEQGIKHHGSGAEWFDTGPASMSSRSDSRKAASAMIAKIPFPLACHIARVWKPEQPFGSDLFG